MLKHRWKHPARLRASLTSKRKQSLDSVESSVILNDMTFNRTKIKKGQDGKTVLALFLFSLLIIAGLPVQKAKAATGEHSAGFGFGQNLLMGDFSKNFSDSLGFQLMYGFEASEMFGLLAHISYSNHSNASGSNSLTIKGIAPDLKINLAYFDKLVLYGLTGFGIYKVDESLDHNAGSVVTLGFDLGAGFLLNLDKHFAFGTSLAFHNIFGKTDTATVNASAPNGITIGGTYMGIFLNLFYIF